MWNHNPNDWHYGAGDGILRELFAACAERIAVSGKAITCYYANEFDLVPTGEPLENSVISLRSLYALRDMIARLAPCFIDLELLRRNRYRKPYDEEDFRYSSEEVLAGLRNADGRREHALAKLPLPYSSPLDEGSLQLVRTFLSDCLWWLKAFRYRGLTSKTNASYKCRSRLEGAFDSDYPENGTKLENALGKLDNDLESVGYIEDKITFSLDVTEVNTTQYEYSWQYKDDAAGNLIPVDRTLSRIDTRQKQTYSYAGLSDISVRNPFAIDCNAFTFNLQGEGTETLSKSSVTKRGPVRDYFTTTESEQTTQEYDLFKNKKYPTLERKTIAKSADNLSSTTQSETLTKWSPDYQRALVETNTYTEPRASHFASEVLFRQFANVAKQKNEPPLSQGVFLPANGTSVLLPPITTVQLFDRYQEIVSALPKPTDDKEYLRTETDIHLRAEYTILFDYNPGYQYPA